ncbi:amino acid aminotransferase [Asticcacaulis sp. ZE23SCel15]|uniref:amino acid aminotransferase n=1 Tax=Asticcacaulis sp. ZE23SCel15 TaxID=3059027 RepID=UPI00265E19E1|nr:amino acid aminotransferase [Asticcacaulis sp. ZE23SCel15]WKL56939.1 amino acid aminotransferase [Asticcacaulis sp. ZE23SCel15]
MTDAATAQRDPFAALKDQPADGLLALIGMYRNDPRTSKIDLGVGVYRNADGATPVMAAVKAAEQRLLTEQTSKSYLGPEGDPVYVELLKPLAFGEPLAASKRLIGVQTPGGTGALKLIAELLKLTGSRVFVGTPTWPNHGPIFKSAGVEVIEHPFFDKATQTVLFDEMMAALKAARAGDAVLLHGCCHNPAGAEFTEAQWQILSDFIVERGLLPIIDLAYQGLGNGLEDDAKATRTLLAAVPNALIAYSCDKNFGLYRERVGAIYALAETEALAQRVLGNILVIARTHWSMPPDHGGAIVRNILQDAELTQIWKDELAETQGRLVELRMLLAAAHPRLAPMAAQTGMFSLLPLSPDQVTALREDNGIYMAGSGRINIAGLTIENIPVLSAALSRYL